MISLQKSSGVNYLVDNNESFGIIREILFRKDLGWLNGFGLFDEATSNLVADHPVVYTHSGNSPRLIPLILILLGFRDPLLVYFISIVIISSVIIFTLYKFLSLFFSKLVVNVTICLFVLNYFSFTQGQFQIYQSFRIMNFLIVLYILTKSLLVNSISKLNILSVSTSVFLIALGDLTFSAIVILFLVLFHIGFRNRVKGYVLKIIFLSWFAGTTLFIIQLFNYYGVNAFLQDIQQTFKLRSTGLENSYESSVSFSVNTNTVNLFSNNVGVYNFYDFFTRLSSEFLLNFELLDILTLLGIVYLFYYTLLKLFFKKKLFLFTELILCSFILMIYFFIFKITYSNDIFWFSINSDTALYYLFNSIDFTDLILFLTVFIGIFIIIFFLKFSFLFLFRLFIFLSICIYFLLTLNYSLTPSGLINHIIIISLSVYLIIYPPPSFQDILNENRYSILVKAAGFYIISVAVINFFLPGYFQNNYFSHNYYLFVVFNYIFIAISISLILIPITDLPRFPLFTSALTRSLIILLIIKALWVNYDHHKLLKTNRFQDIIVFLQENRLSDSGFVSDNYPGFISIFANTWGHWDSAYLQNRYNIGCKLAFDRRLNNNQTIRMDGTIFPKYYIAAPPINYLQLPYYIQNGESSNIEWKAQLQNNMLPGDQIIFEETDSLTGSMIIKLSPCK